MQDSIAPLRPRDVLFSLFLHVQAARMPPAFRHVRPVGADVADIAAADEKRARRAARNRAVEARKSGASPTELSPV